jgi:hypothetical protein
MVVAPAVVFGLTLDVAGALLTGGLFDGKTGGAIMTEGA